MGADLVCAARGQAELLSCQECKSRLLLLAKAQKKTAAASGEALLPCLGELAPALRQAPARDNGSETAWFRELERAILTHLLLQAAFALAVRHQRLHASPPITSKTASSSKDEEAVATGKTKIPFTAPCWHPCAGPDPAYGWNNPIRCHTSS